MLSQSILTEYLQYIEFQILIALDERKASKKGDITATITRAIQNLGIHRGFKVRNEAPYNEFQAEPSGYRCDVLWEGNENILWEIDRTHKPRTIEKLAGIPATERIWVVWAEDAETKKPAPEMTGNACIITISGDVRKLIWDRIRAEKGLARDLQHVLNQKHRFHSAQKLSEQVQLGAGFQ